MVKQLRDSREPEPLKEQGLFEVIVGYHHQPLCQQLLDQQFNFILVCRPESHTNPYEHLEGIELTNW